MPEIVKPYIGHFFQNEPHIHIYVEGFKDLAWAIPLSEYNFPILEISSASDLVHAIHACTKEINIVTAFVIQHTIL